MCEPPLCLRRRPPAAPSSRTLAPWGLYARVHRAPASAAAAQSSASASALPLTRAPPLALVCPRRAAPRALRAIRGPGRGARGCIAAGYSPPTPRRRLHLGLVTPAPGRRPPPRAPRPANRPPTGPVHPSLPPSARLLPPIAAPPSIRPPSPSPYLISPPRDPPICRTNPSSSPWCSARTFPSRSASSPSGESALLPPLAWERILLHGPKQSDHANVWCRRSCACFHGLAPPVCRPARFFGQQAPAPMSPRRLPLTISLPFLLAAALSAQAWPSALASA